MDSEIMDDASEPKEAPEENITEQKKPLLQSSWISITLLVLIVLLYVLFFMHSFSKPKLRVIPEAAFTSKKGGLTIAFVNNDSIKTHYQLVLDLQQNLENKYANLNKDISGKQALLENKANDLQKKFDNKQITLEEAQKMDEMLKMEGKKLYDLNQEYSDKMAEEEVRVNKVFVDSINNFLKRFNKQYNFDYILGYSKGGGILYARDTLDITQYVLEGLNEEYTNKYPESKKKQK